MNMKDWLERARNIESEIAVLEEAKAKAIDTAVYQSPSFAEAVQHSPANSVEKKSVAYTEYVEQLDLAQTKLLCARKDALKTISALSDSLDRAILIDYYVNGLTAAQIADKLGYDTSHIYRKRDKAIEKLEKIYR